jgi:hypothetical protein
MAVAAITVTTATMMRTVQPCRLYHSVQACRVRLPNSRALCAQWNSVASTASPANTTSQPGPGKGTMTRPPPTMSPPSTPMTIFRVSAPARVDLMLSSLP